MNKRMSILFNGNSDRIEVLKMPNGGIDIYRHGVIRIPNGERGTMPHRCSDLDESLFQLGPEETKKLMEFLAA
jgi:hypothetical protein